MCQPQFFSTTTLRLSIRPFVLFLCLNPVVANASDDSIQLIKDAVGDNAFHTHNSDGSLTVQIDSEPAVVLKALASLDEAHRRRVDHVVFTCAVPDSPDDLRLLEKLTRLKGIDVHQGRWKPTLSEVVSKSKTIKSIWAQPEGNAGLTGKDLALICQAKQLACLMIEGNQLSGQDIAPLGKLNELRQLNLAGFPLESKDVMWLGSLKELTTLWFCDMNVDDAIVPELCKCTKLGILVLTRTNVSQDGAAALRRALPSTIISSGGKESSEALALPLKP
jgi:hypothetical protein